MASDEKKRPLENGDAAVAGGDSTAASPRDPGDAERQPLTNGGAEPALALATDPHKEKLLAEDGTPAAVMKGSKKGAGAGTLSRLTMRRQELEEHLRSRTGLSRQGLLWAMAVVMLLLLLAVITLALALAWPRIPHKMQYPACTSTACLLASAQVRRAKLIISTRPASPRPAQAGRIGGVPAGNKGRGKAGGARGRPSAR